MLQKSSGYYKFLATVPVLGYTSGFSTHWVAKHSLYIIGCSPSHIGN